MNNSQLCLNQRKWIVISLSPRRKLVGEKKKTWYIFCVTAIFPHLLSRHARMTSTISPFSFTLGRYSDPDSPLISCVALTDYPDYDEASNRNSSASISNRKTIAREKKRTKLKTNIWQSFQSRPSAIYRMDVFSVETGTGRNETISSFVGVCVSVCVCFRCCLWFCRCDKLWKSLKLNLIQCVSSLVLFDGVTSNLVF